MKGKRRPPKRKSNRAPEPRADRSAILQGRLSTHHRGFGFVKPHNLPLAADVFIPANMMLDSIDGDIVEVLLADITDPRPEGRILSVIERSHHEVGAIVSGKNDKDWLLYAPLLGVKKKILIHSKKKVRIGDRWVIQLKALSKGKDDTPDELRATFVRFIAPLEDASSDIEAAVSHFCLRSSFPPEVLEEAKRFGTRVPLQEIRHREDIRSLFTVTIDPATAQDLDDAISLEKKGDRFHLAVHVADVSHYMKQGSAMEKEAMERGNSTYFPGRVLPMIPKQLSEELCSLRPHRNRLAVTVFMEIDEKGDLQNYRIAKTVIKSDHRLTYEKAMELLSSKRKTRLTAFLRDLKELTLLLKLKRQERGCIDLVMREIGIILDEREIPTTLTTTEYDLSHQVIEECMLKANEVVATHLGITKEETVYRIHEPPDGEKSIAFYRFLRNLGGRLPKDPTPAQIQSALEAIEEPTLRSLATTFYIRTNKMAVYSSQNLGHHGLRLKNYTHFTSPIRRYVDWLNHDLLFETKGEKRDFVAISDSCSKKERISARAEAHLMLLKKLRLLQIEQEADPTTVYRAIVTEIKPFGISFEVELFMIDGFTPLSKLKEDYFLFDPNKRTLVGRKSGSEIRIGTPLLLTPLSIDCIFLEVEWKVNQILRF